MWRGDTLCWAYWAQLSTPLSFQTVLELLGEELRLLHCKVHHPVEAQVEEESHNLDLLGQHSLLHLSLGELLQQNCSLEPLSEHKRSLW